MLVIYFSNERRIGLKKADLFGAVVKRSVKGNRKKEREKSSRLVFSSLCCVCWLISC